MLKTLMKSDSFLGNLPLGATCVICEEECSVDPGLVDFQCCWCQRTVHTECLPKVDKVKLIRGF